MMQRLSVLLLLFVVGMLPARFAKGSEFVHVVTASPIGKELTRDGRTVVDLDGDRGPGQPTAQGGLWSEVDGFHTDVPLQISAYSKDGSTLVGYLQEVDGRVPVIWREPSGVQQVPTLPATEFHSFQDFTADGSAFVGWLRKCEGGDCQWLNPTIWEQGEPVPLSETDIDWWEGPMRVSDDGRFVAFMTGPSGEDSLKSWTEEDGFVDLGVSSPDGFRIGDFLMSADGRAIAGRWSNLDDQYKTRLWRWTPNEGVTELGPLPIADYTYSTIHDMSADGETMVGIYGPDAWGDWENNRAFVWDTQNGMRDLEQVLVDEYGFTPGKEVRMEHAMGISDDRKTILTYRRDNPFLGPWRLVKLDWPIGPPTDDGDMNFDDVVDAADIDLQMEAIRQYPKAAFHDLDFSGQVDGDDLTYLIKNTLNTWFGDANLDGEFDASDLVQVLQVGMYEAPQSVGWSEGDWNGDGLFGTADLVKALEDGGYEVGRRMDATAVPEPCSGTLALAAGVVAALMRSSRRRRRS